MTSAHAMPMLTPASGLVTSSTDYNYGEPLPLPEEEFKVIPSQSRFHGFAATTTTNDPAMVIKRSNAWTAAESFSAKLEKHQAARQDVLQMIRALVAVSFEAEVQSPSSTLQIFGTTPDRWDQGATRLAELANVQDSEEDETIAAHPRALDLANQLLVNLRNGTFPREQSVFAKPQGRLVNIGIDGDGSVAFEFGAPGSSMGTTLQCGTDGSLTRYDYGGPDGFQTTKLGNPFSQ